VFFSSKDDVRYFYGNDFKEYDDLFDLDTHGHLDYVSHEQDTYDNFDEAMDRLMKLVEDEDGFELDKDEFFEDLTEKDKDQEKLFEIAREKYVLMLIRKLKLV
jgi:hypothetical protein